MARLVVQIARCTARTFTCSHKQDFLATPVTKLLLPAARSLATGHSLRAERWYTDKHEWVTVDDNIGTVGISDYAQDALGDVVFAQLPDVGSEIKKEDECGALESVKAASEVISPVSGIVKEKNEAVENKPGLINSSCYNEGWLFKVQLSNPDEIKSLMNEEAYNLFLKSESH